MIYSKKSLIYADVHIFVNLSFNLYFDFNEMSLALRLLLARFEQIIVKPHSGVWLAVPYLASPSKHQILLMMIYLIYSQDEDGLF